MSTMQILESEERAGQLAELYTKQHDIFSDARTKAEAIQHEIESLLSGTAIAPANGRKKRGRKKKTETTATSQKVTKKAKKAVRKRPKNEHTLAEVVMAILKSDADGLKLDELVTKVIESGWKTGSQKKKNDAYTQLVYQCLHKQMNPDKGSPLVTKDDESRRYRLTAKGQKAA